MKLLAPFVPARDDPWDARKAAHLARRAGFGATRDELAAAVEAGLEASVARAVDLPERDDAAELALERAGGGLAQAAGGAVGVLRRAWFVRMVHGSQPLREKVALFWHDHFATQESKVLRAPLLSAQLDLLRGRSLGSFRALLGGIARDPAMLVQLDNRLSDARNPNENWARELLELYTLGVDRYAQADVVALARVFTGWTTPAPHIGRFTFDPALHDAGDKVLFGQPLAGRGGEDGVREGEQALDRIVARPECARFLAAKLAEWFVHPEPSAQAVDELAAVLSANELSVGETLRTLFTSRWFYAPENELALYKNPVELAAGTLRVLGVQNAHLAGLEELSRHMGMQLFEPPSVAGWEHGAAWIDSGSVVQRLNFAHEVSELPHSSRSVSGRPALDLDRLAPASDDATPEALAALCDALAARLLPLPLDEGRRALVARQAVAAAAGDDDPHRARRSATRAALHLLLSAPEFALA